jgi:hypothetical protein
MCHWSHYAGIAIAVVVVVVVIEHYIQTCCTNRRNCHSASLLELRRLGTAAQVLGTAGEEALDIVAAVVLGIFEGQVLDTVVVERSD